MTSNNHLKNCFFALLPGQNKAQPISDIMSQLVKSVHELNETVKNMKATMVIENMLGYELQEVLILQHFWGKHSSENIKDMWRWKLIHARANLAQIAVEISGLEGSGYDEFISDLNTLSSQGKVNIVAVNQLIKRNEQWLNQKLQLFDKEYKELYYGVYEGMKNGMYGGMAPDPTRWIKGFNKGEKWREIFNKKVET